MLNLKLKKILVSVFILVFIYSNLFIITSLPLQTNGNSKFVSIDYSLEEVVININLRFFHFTYSLPDTLFVLFNSAGVFDGGGATNSDDWINSEYVFYGLFPDTNNWQELDIINKYFPYSRGEQASRLTLPWHNMLGSQIFVEESQNLLNKIQTKYNIDNPKNKISKLALYKVSWPYSEKSWLIEKRTENTIYNLIYTN
jgi:hypothetical protein